jgi:hypothetical protein
MPTLLAFSSAQAECPLLSDETERGDGGEPVEPLWGIRRKGKLALGGREDQIGSIGFVFNEWNYLRRAELGLWLFG